MPATSRAASLSRQRGSAYVSIVGGTGWTVAAESSDPDEERPGSKGKLPGNTWARISVTDSATENRPPARRVRERVKRWGKSPPRARQRARHGKPQLEQGQAGGEMQPTSIKTPRVGRTRTRATVFLEK